MNFHERLDETDNKVSTGEQMTPVGDFSFSRSSG